MKKTISTLAFNHIKNEDLYNSYGKASLDHKVVKMTTTNVQEYYLSISL